MSVVKQHDLGDGRGGSS